MKSIRDNIALNVGNNLIDRLGANISGSCKIETTIYLTKNISGFINRHIRKNVSQSIYLARQQFRFKNLR